MYPDVVMSEITLKVPDETLLALKVTPDQLADYGVDSFRLTQADIEHEMRLA